MSGMQAALGLAQLERIDELIERKHRIFNWYRDELRDVEGIILNSEAKGTKNTYWMVTVILDKKYGITKESLIGAMAEKNIDCRPFFYPLSSLPAYMSLGQAKEATARNTTSYAVSPLAVNLPSGLDMTSEKVKYVCDSMKLILRDRS
jgi:perosamine synthetase